MNKLVYKQRRGTNCVKWDILEKKYKNPDLLSMWIADMDFESPECVREALNNMIDLGVYGYYLPPDGGNRAFINWQKKHYSLELENEWLRYAPGVVAGLHWGVLALTEPGDVIAALTPVYQAFLNVADATGRRLVTCDLINNEGNYTIDFDGLEKLLVQNQVKLLLFCSPHNPVGRVWKKEELEQVLQLCQKYKVILLADEIHQDICLHANKHTPAVSFPGYEDYVVSVTAPTKTFNMAGSQTAVITVPNKKFRDCIDTLRKSIGCLKGNSFSYVMSEAAYSGGQEWLDQLIRQLEINEAYVRKILCREGSPVIISPLEGTYLLWVDFSKAVNKKDMKQFIENECGLALCYGTQFGSKKYECFVRMNIATSFENIKMAADNIAGALF